MDFGDGAREAYIDHVQHVLKVVPKERLLILRFGEQSDWHDLCDFLGKKPPDEPYPVVDESASDVDAAVLSWMLASRVVIGRIYAFTLGSIMAAFWLCLIFMGWRDCCPGS